MKSVNETHSIQNIKVKAILSSGDNEKKQTSSYISNNSGIDKSLYTSLSGSNEVSSHFVTKNENKLITSITQNSEQKKKYEDLCKKFVDIKQKIVIF